MTERPVVFIAFTEHDNLGIGYMTAVLKEAGYSTGIVDFRKDKKEILEELANSRPLVVGFSVIFENHIYEFEKLILFLRKNGIDCHFTAGGHFASLRPEELFRLAPSLDSIVRFEGEYTLLQMAGCLKAGTHWKAIQGISYPDKGNMIHNPLRELERDLDQFPFPVRSTPKKYAQRKKQATLVAGRGCVYQCTFCDIREFYSQPPGSVKRVRNPVKVVAEMVQLHEENEVSIFLFQDDDFPVKSRSHPDWIIQFCTSLSDTYLAGKIMWKINCRPDEIDRESFELMRQHGLFRVYLGIEDGTDSGLKAMNKKLNAADHLEGIKILKELGILIDYGFMLFQPETSYQSLNENLNFLESICKDGYMPAKFLKMMPYLETEIEKTLRKQGRLKGIPGFLDYDFRDESMNDFYKFVMSCFRHWLNSGEGFSNMASWAANYLAVYYYFNHAHPGINKCRNELRQVISQANIFLITTMKHLSAKFQSGQYDLDDDPELLELKENIEVKHLDYLEQMKAMITKTELYSITSGLFL